MKDDFNAGATSEFIARLSRDERFVYKAFIAIQTDPANTALLVFRGANGVVMSATTAQKADLARFVRNIMQDDPHTYNSLVMALNPKRGFQGQWDREPGTKDGLISFLVKPMICVPGLDDVLHNKMKLIHSTNHPQQTGNHARPQLRLIQGGLNL